jgi:cytoskeletal protein CcmA (bactofilin family)
MPALQPVANTAPQGEINTLLGKGTSFEGKLTFEGTVRIDGRLAGEVFSDDILVVGEGAEVRAKIEIGTLIVEGLIEGDIRASKLVELRAPARVRGNIETPQLIVEKGVLFQGHCKMEDPGARPAGAPKPPAATPQKSPTPTK